LIYRLNMPNAGYYTCVVAVSFMDGNV
jgi:hypothetical protein